MSNCVACGASLEGRFCGVCGRDSELDVVVPRNSPTVPAPPSAPDGPPSDSGRFPDIGTALTVGWNGLIGRFGQWIGTFGISAGIVVAWIACFVLYSEVITKTTRSYRFSNNYGYDLEYHRTVPIALAALIVLAILAGTWIRLAFARVALGVATDQRPSIAEIWSLHGYLRFLGATLLAWLVTLSFGIFTILAILPAAVVLYTPFVAVEGLGSAVTCVFRSISITTAPGRFWRQVLFVLILFATAGALTLAYLGVALLIVFAASGISVVVALLALGAIPVLLFVSAYVWSARASLYVRFTRPAEGGPGTPAPATGG